MTSAQLFLFLLMGGAGLWVLHKIGQAITKALEAAAAIAVVFLSIWLAVKGTWRAGRWLVRHPRTTLASAAAGAWLYWWGWLSLAVTLAVLAAGLGVWRLVHLGSFEPWAGRRLRGWWQRWIFYGHRMPGWLRSCGLAVGDARQPLTVQVNPFKRSVVQPKIKPRPDQTPRLIGCAPDLRGTRSACGSSPGRPRRTSTAPPAPWLWPGRSPAARSARSPRTWSRSTTNAMTGSVTWCGVRPSRSSGTRGGSSSISSGCGAGAPSTAPTGTPPSRAATPSSPAPPARARTPSAGRPSSPMAPAIRDGLVRVWAIDPKGMELAYGRRAFHRYAVTSAEALALLDELVAGMEARKAEFSGRLRVAPVSRETPLELLEFDEIGALIRYVGDRKTREVITDRIALLTTQGRALGYTVRGYVQEPTKDTVPVRELFPRRICLRVASKAHVAMVLGDLAYDRGAWANRIGESEAGVGYLFGEGIREPLRVRAGWVPDETIKALEDFVTAPAPALAIPDPRLALPVAPAPARGAL